MSRSNRRSREDGQQKKEHESPLRRFSTRLHDLYLALVTSIEGIADVGVRSRYASLLLYRLIFMQFLQQSGILADQRRYLQGRLQEQRSGDESFYRGVLRPLFDGREQTIVGELLLAGFFCSHEIERDHPAIEVADEFFVCLFAFFDEYQWQFDEETQGSAAVITPTVLGELFERDTYPQELGVHYTPREVTAYIARNTVLPALFARTHARCTDAGSLESRLRQTLAREPLRYLQTAARKGYELELPPEISAGCEDLTLRASWQHRASPPYALPGEIWREVIARRTRVDEILHGIHRGMATFERLVTWNLDLPLLARHALSTCQQPEVLQACYQSLRQLSVLDPTCGSGAFLCAVVPLLQDLYAVCLTRMEELFTARDRTSLPAAAQRIFEAHLEEAGEPSLRAFTCLQWIIEHNLYGVDLSEEAVEVCRLRLYLKLLALRPAHQPMLEPDSFARHIRVGNSLLASLSEGADAQATQGTAELTRYQRTFCWQQAFPTPMQRGGFDVVLGNPPYVEYQRVRPFYTLTGYTTLATDNLYALTMERATDLLAPGGRFGMIVPSSATCTDGYRSLQKLLLAQQELHIASFSDQRGHLFSLPHPRLCVILYARADVIHEQPGKLFTTPYLKLGKASRTSLFEQLSYTEISPDLQSGLIPRYGSPLEMAIARKLARQAATLGTYRRRNGEYPIYFTRKLSWFVQVTPFIPRILDEQQNLRVPSELKTLRFSSLAHARLAFVALNSNLFYWLITTRSDCRNLNMREVLGLPLDLASVSSTSQQELCHLADELERDLLKHARARQMAFQKQGRLTIQCMYPVYSKPLIDQIDRTLARHYAFDSHELDFLLHYDEQYRRAKYQ